MQWPPTRPNFKMAQNYKQHPSILTKYNILQYTRLPPFGTLNYIAVNLKLDPGQPEYVSPKRRRWVSQESRHKSEDDLMHFTKWLLISLKLSYCMYNTSSWCTVAFNLLETFTVSENVLVVNLCWLLWVFLAQILLLALPWRQPEIRDFAFKKPIKCTINNSPKQDSTWQLCLTQVRCALTH